MSKQREPWRIGIYCDRCHRQTGRRRLLAEVLQDYQGGWTVRVPVRPGRRAAIMPPSIDQPQSIWGREQTLYPGKPSSMHGAARSSPGSRTVLLAVEAGRAVQLICPDRRCSARSREAWSRLVELAEAAQGAGRADAYA